MSQSAFSLENLLLSLAVLGILYTMFRRKPERELRAWHAIWAALALHYAFQQLRFAAASHSNWSTLAERWFFFLATLALLYAAREYGGRRPAPRSTIVVGVIGTVGMLVQTFW